jgi:peptidoglycan hydrolase-like protein with peptidoglycan-binding domain
VLSSALFVASTAYAHAFDGEWRGTGKCGSGGGGYTISLAVQGTSVTGQAQAFGIKAGYRPEGFSFRGQVDPSGAVTLTEAASGANQFSGRVSGRRMTFKGWTGENNCEFALDQVGAPQVAAASPSSQPAAPVTPDRVAPAQPAASLSAPVVKPSPVQSAKPTPPANPERDAFIGRSAPEMTTVQRSLAALGFYRGDPDGHYGPGTAGAIEAWQRSQGLSSTGYLTVSESDRLKKQALAQLGGPPAPPTSPPSAIPAPETADPERRGPETATTQPAPAPRPAAQVEWSQLRGTWIPLKDYSAARCSGKSPYPPPDSYLDIQQDHIGQYEAGCNITAISRASQTDFKVAMRCWELPNPQDLSKVRTQLFSLLDSRLNIDGTPYVRCLLPGFSSGPPVTSKESSDRPAAPKPNPSPKASQSSPPTAQPPATSPELTKLAPEHIPNRSAFPIGSAIQVFYDRPIETVKEATDPPFPVVDLKNLTPPIRKFTLEVVGLNQSASLQIVTQASVSDADEFCQRVHHLSVDNNAYQRGGSGNLHSGVSGVSA